MTRISRYGEAEPLCRGASELTRLLPVRAVALTRFTAAVRFHAGGSDNVLKTVNQGTDGWSRSLHALGATTVITSSIVNSLHFATDARPLSITTRHRSFRPRYIGANV